MKLLLILPLLLLAIWEPVEGYKILFISAMGIKSHKNFCMNIAKELAAKGHEITMISLDKSSQVIPNIEEIVIDVEVDLPEGSFILDTEELTLYNEMMYTVVDICFQMLATPEMQALKQRKFDLVVTKIIYDHCFLSLAHHFKVPIVYTPAMGLTAFYLDLTGNVRFPSLTTDKLTSIEYYPFNFWQRFRDAITSAYISWYFLPAISDNFDRRCRELKLCPPDMPHLTEISNNVSLTIVSSVKTLEWPPYPISSNIIFAGGAHCRPAKPLPQELNKWVEESKHGIIYFSMGSYGRISKLPKSLRKILFDTFGLLKERVLFKSDVDHHEEAPDNVKVSKWFPQQDILGHPKLKLFISHGGQSSTLEATYHGVPILGMPCFLDQMSNIGKIVSDGWGSSVQWVGLTKEEFHKALVNTLNNKSFREVAQSKSFIMRDQPRSPAQEAAYWMEYVIRHKGAKHLRSPILTTPTYVLYNMDVWFTVLILCLLLLISILKSIQIFFRVFIFKRNISKKKKE